MPTPGAPMRKVVPPRLVGPYLTGQRDVLAGYVYRAEDPRLTDPAALFGALRLGFDGSDFTPGIDEYYAIGWPARNCEDYRQADDGELYIDPIAIPVGAAMLRVRAESDEVVAEYDGLSWLQLTGEA
jgi:hypothetical protein